VFFKIFSAELDQFLNPDTHSSFNPSHPQQSPNTGNASGPHPIKCLGFAGPAIIANPGIARRRIDAPNLENATKILSLFPYIFQIFPSLFPLSFSFSFSFSLSFSSLFFSLFFFPSSFLPHGLNHGFPLASRRSAARCVGS
jgi:hypothetical protein